jgi:hypothetical protein
MLAGVGVDSFLQTPVHGEIGLLIPFKVKRGNANAAFQRVLPYGGSNSPPMPIDLSGKAYIN